MLNLLETLGYEIEFPETQFNANTIVAQNSYGVTPVFVGGGIVTGEFDPVPGYVYAGVLILNTLHFLSLKFLALHYV